MGGSLDAHGDGTNLLCGACHQELSLVKSSIEKHLGSPKHKDNCKLGLEVKKHAARIDTILTRQHQEVK